MVKTKIRLIIFFAAKDGEASHTVSKTRLGAHCGSDHELLIAKFRLKVKKVGKTNRPVRYNLIPYHYTVEVRERFKGLDLMDGVPEELWTEVLDTVQEAVIKTIPQKKKCKKAKWLSEEALQIAVKRREETNRMGKTRDLFKKIRDTKGTFYAKMGTIKEEIAWTQQRQKILKRGGKNTQTNSTKKIFMTQIIMMV